MTLSLLPSAPAFVECGECHGTGEWHPGRGIDPDWCGFCGGTGEDWLDLSPLATLAFNLGIAAGLCMTFWEGWEQREHHDLYSAHGYRTEQDWRPGCGKRAP